MPTQPIHLAGTPATRAKSGTSLVTTHPAATRAQRPIVTGATHTLRAPIDAFFDKVIVNDPDGEVRARRLNLLARFRDAVHRVADFSRIEG